MIYDCPPHQGTLAVGSDADIVLWDLSATWTLTKTALHDSLDYTPYEGFQIRGAPVLTMLRGRIMFRRSSVRGSLNIGALDTINASEGQVRVHLSASECL